VRDGDSLADAGGAQVLTPLQHLEKDSLRLFVQPQKADQLLQDLVLGRALQVEVDRVFREELTKFHMSNPVGQSRSVM
jgi:hypothetical protein